MSIGIRDANERDMRFVRKLALESALYGVPYGRNISNQAIRARVRDTIKDIRPDEDTAVLIAFDEASDKAMGYLILDLSNIEGTTGERQSYIHDLAVQKNTGERELSLTW